MYKYSASENAFFLMAIHGSAVPEDVKPVSAEHYSYLMAQQAEGMLICPDPDGNPVAVDRPAVIIKPSTCTPAQGLVALFALKQVTEDHVLEAIAQIPDPVQQYTARIGYQRATTWERGSPTMLAMAQLLQLSDEDLDALFSYAVSVQV